MKRIKVFFGCNESGVAWWRAKQPGQKLMENDLCDVEMFSIYDSDPSKADEIIGAADVIYTPSPCGVEAVVEFLKYYKNGKHIVADYDDDLFNCHPFNPGYKTLGLNEIKIRIGDGPEQYLYKDNQHGFSVKDNRIRHDSHVDVMNVVDYVTTTTPFLKNKLHDGSGRKLEDIRIIPNSIDFNLFKPFDTKLKDHSKLRIGWVASDSHLLEFQIVSKFLDEMNSRRSDFQFVILGNLNDLKAAFSRFNIEWHPFADLSIYPLKFASLELDIGICPLEDHSFNRCKSALKWSEYASLRIPAVCSDVEPYKIITHGVDGMLAKDPVAMADAVCQLMDSTKLREAVADGAYEHNFDHYNLDKNVMLWYQCFLDAYGRNRTLTYNGVPIPKESVV